MRRRAFITLLGGAAAAVCPLAVHSQQSSRMRHIGVLMSLEENDPEGKVQLSGFTQGLSDLGWTNGSNLRMEVRWGGGDVNQIRAFAKELVAAQPDLILSQGTPVTAALQRETRTIPIVDVLRGERTSAWTRQMSANDPQATLPFNLIAFTHQSESLRYPS